MTSIRPSHSHHLDTTICLVIFFISMQILMEYSVNKQSNPDQMPRSAASDLGLDCFFITCTKRLVGLDADRLAQISCRASSRDDLRVATW